MHSLLGRHGARHESASRHLKYDAKFGEEIELDIRKLTTQKILGHELYMNEPKLVGKGVGCRRFLQIFDKRSMWTYLS